MELVKKERLGDLDFFGQFAIAFREVYANGDWKFVIVSNNNRFVLITY